MRIARRKNFLLSELTAMSLRRQGHSVGARVEFLGRPIVTCRGQGHIWIGDRVVLCSQSKRTSLGVARPVILRTLAEGAVLTIGEDSGLSGTTVCASGSITIGKRC